ncbi:MAG: sialidase family protein [Propionibacteriaceae bacterium]|nr:sialidase family protein [Propionibacteriaceae bacterium]
MELVTLAEGGVPLPGSDIVDDCYRIPALAVTASGRLLAAWDVRPDWRDLPGSFDLVLRASDDGGRTWGPTRVIREGLPGHGFGDASLIADPDSSRVWCWYAGSTGRSFFTADAGPEGAGLELWLAESSDDGETWTHRDLTTALKPGTATGMFAASGNGAVIDHEGGRRLLQPFVIRTVAEEHYAAIAHSDDLGQTWTLGDWVGPDCDENKVVGVPGGGVLLHARARPRRRQAWSSDGVAYGSPEPAPELVDPACNGGLAVWGEHLVCTLLDDPTQRRRVGLRLSSDGGASWSESVLIDAGAAGYSVCAELADGALGVLWEAGDYAALRFARIEPAEVGRDGGAVTLVADPGVPGVAKPPEVQPDGP